MSRVCVLLRGILFSFLSLYLSVYPSGFVYLYFCAPVKRYGGPIDHYEQFRETGKPVSKQRPVITSPICRTFVDEATTGYDVKGDVARDLH